jgi:hypothetical protein
MNELDTLKALHSTLGALIAAKELGTPTAGPDAPVAPTIPAGHFYMPKTGHILPPVGTVDNAISGYMIRNFSALGLPYPASFRMAGIAAAWAGDTPTGPQHRDLWPEAADRAANPTAYMTPEELAAYRAAEEAGKLADFISTRPPIAPTLPGVGSE